jgi:hypothetical protein
MNVEPAKVAIPVIVAATSPFTNIVFDDDDQLGATIVRWSHFFGQSGSEVKVYSVV